MRWKIPALRIGKEYYEKRKQLLLLQQEQEQQLKEIEENNNKEIKFEGVLEIPIETKSAEDSEIDFSHNILFEDRFDRAPDNPEEIKEANEAGSESHSHVDGDSSSDTASPILPVVSNHTLPLPETVPVAVPNIMPILEPISIADQLVLADLQSYGPGWRVEFRPLEVQLTDYENAAFSIFVVLLTRCIASQGHNFYLPISYVEENVKRAQIKDAVLNQKFWIRRNAIAKKSIVSGSPQSLSSPPAHSDFDFSSSSSDPLIPPSPVITPHPLARTSVNYQIPSLDDLDLVELTMDEIFNGEKASDISENEENHRFPGLVPMLMDYLTSLGCDDRLYLKKELLPYFTLLSEKASGKLPTTARWIRNQLIKDPSNFNEETTSIKPEAINQLLSLCEDIGMGRVQAPDLYGHRGLQQSTEGAVDEVKKETHLPTVIPNLDHIDEEDLMFTNFSCYLKPTVLFSDLNESYSLSSSINITELNLNQMIQQSKLDREIREEEPDMNVSSICVEIVNQDLPKNESSSTSSATSMPSSSTTSVSKLQSITNFVKSFFQRKKRTKEESIRF
jgi:hypothetical protein